jgi:hypothetical protein
VEVNEGDNPFARLHEEQAELLGHCLVYLKVTRRCSGNARHALHACVAGWRVV